VDEYVGDAEDRAPVIEQRLCDQACRPPGGNGEPGGASCGPRDERGQARQGRVRLYDYRREDTERERVTIFEFPDWSDPAGTRGPAGRRANAPLRVHHGFGEILRLPAMLLAGAYGTKTKEMVRASSQLR
jgi:hypothetical protein